MTIQEDIQNAIAKNELYAVGDTPPENWQKAFEAYAALAKQGNVKAQYNLGYMYARGDIMERDFAKAFEWYEKAANNDDPRAHYNLSQMYEQGDFVLVNTIKAQEHMARAIVLGDDRAKLKTTLANAKEALKLGERSKAESLFASLIDNKEAEMGIIACSAEFKSIYNVSIKYSYHSSGSEGNKKFWKWGEAVITEVDLIMTNNSPRSWRVFVRALIRSSDGVVSISTIGGVLKTKESQSNIIDPDNYGASKICGVAIYSDREGSPDKPIYSFDLPDVSVQPGEEEKRNLSHKILQAQDDMAKHNKTAKPSDCFVLTACYGSYDAPTVLAFRQFRDNHLTRYTLGRYFIAWYYRHGPQWASAIDNKPGLKAIFRALFNLLAKVLPR